MALVKLVMMMHQVSWRQQRLLKFANRALKNNLPASLVWTAKRVGMQLQHLHLHPHLQTPVRCVMVERVPVALAKIVLHQIS